MSGRPFFLPNPYREGTLRWHAWWEGYRAQITEHAVNSVLLGGVGDPLDRADEAEEVAEAETEARGDA
jgi:hypothetical protein